MKICLVSHQVKDILSGPGLHTNILVQAIIEAGHQLIILGPENQRPANLQGCRYEGVRPLILPNNLSRWIPLSMSYQNALNRLENETSFNLIHFTDFREGLLCNTRAPIIVNVNDTYTIEPNGLKYYLENYYDGFKRWLFLNISKLIEQSKISRFNILIANSKYTADTIQKYYLEIAGNIEIIYKGIQTDTYTSIIEDKKYKNTHNPMILYVGGNMQRKGVPDLIRATSIIRNSIPKIRVVIVGKDPIVPKLIVLSKKLGVEENIEFMGYMSHDKLVSLYSQADLFVMPSLIEAFGVSILEAMAAGVPVIATNVGGIPEIIQNGVNGITIPPRNPNILAKAIIDIHFDPDSKEKYRKSGLSTIQNFSSEIMVSRTFELYKQLAD